MATQIQFRRGSATQHEAFTGALGEVTVNTTNDSLHVHDGSTVGGFEAAKADLSNHSGVGVLTATTFSGNLDASSATINNTIVGGATTELIVNGDCRITGILTIGTSSITLDSTTDTITATNFNGAITGAVTGNSDSATALETARDFQITGDVASTAISFDGTSNVGLAVTLADNISINDLVVTGNTTVGGGVTITGNLVVNGTTTTINSTTLSVDDKNIELASTASPSDSTADGGGITLKGTTDHTFNWVNSTDSWTSSEHMDLASGKSYYINNTSVLSSTTLGSAVVNSSLTSVGTLGSLTISGATSAAHITASGIVTATDFNATSDIALKQEVSVIDNALEMINQLEGVSWKWKETLKPSLGVTAQNVETVAPQLVSNGEHKTVNYNGLIGILIQAVKELSEKVEKLEG